MKRFFINMFEKNIEKTKLSNSFVDTIFVLITLLTLGAFSIDSYLLDNLSKVSLTLAYIPFAGLALLCVLIIAVITFYNGVLKRHGYVISVLVILITLKSILVLGTKLVMSKIGSVIYFISNWMINFPISGLGKYLFLEKMLSAGEIYLLLISFIGIIYTIGYLFGFIIEKNNK